MVSLKIVSITTLIINFNFWAIQILQSLFTIWLGNQRVTSSSYPTSPLTNDFKPIGTDTTEDTYDYDYNPYLYEDTEGIHGTYTNFTHIVM